MKKTAFEIYLDGRTRTAGAQPRDLTGSVFGELTVVEFIGKGTDGKLWWRCRCSCGATRDVGAFSLSTAGKSHIWHCGNITQHSPALDNSRVLRRFFSKFTKKADDECWPVKKPGYQGYRSFDVRGEKVRMHRFSYEHFVGPIPNGLEVRHKCDNPRCVNPRHLETRTHAQNMADMAIRERGPRLLSKAQVLEIQASNESSLVLSQRFGVSARHIRKVRAGTRRSHV